MPEWALEIEPILERAKQAIESQAVNSQSSLTRKKLMKELTGGVIRPFEKCLLTQGYVNVHSVPLPNDAVLLWNGRVMYQTAKGAALRLAESAPDPLRVEIVRQLQPLWECIQSGTAPEDRTPVLDVLEVCADLTLRITLEGNEPRGDVLKMVHETLTDLFGPQVVELDVYVPEADPEPEVHIDFRAFRNRDSGGSD